MTAIAEPLNTRARPSAAQMARWAISDSLVMTRRNLLVWLRVPAYIVFTVVQPVIFVLLFRYVFGGAIHTASAGGYVNYLMPGIIAQTAAFATFATAIALAQEATKGVIDRFRAMPMARSAVLAGRLIADSIRMLIVILVIIGVGYAVGFRFQNGVVGAIGMVLLAEAFGIARLFRFGVRGTRDQGRGIGASLRSDLDIPADIRKFCFRPGLDDAELAAGLREQPAGDTRHQRDARDGVGRPGVSAEPGALGERGVARGSADRLRPVGGSELPAGRLETSRPVRASDAGRSVIALDGVAEVVVNAAAESVGATDNVEEITDVVIRK